MSKAAATLMLIVLTANLGLAAETSFRTVKVPDLKGKHAKATLTYSDSHKAIEIRPAKGDAVSIPYAEIDKCSYQYTQEMTAAFNESKTHWLQIDYHEQEARKVQVLLLDKHDYLRVLDALKTHTGIDAEILGNADKRHGGVLRK